MKLAIPVLCAAVGLAAPQTALAATHAAGAATRAAGTAAHAAGTQAVAAAQIGHHKLVARFLARQAKLGHLNSPIEPGGKRFVRALQKMLRKDGYAR